MITSFIINCKNCPIPTPVDIHIEAQAPIIDLQFRCRGCGLAETQRVILGPPKPPPTLLGVDPWGRPIEMPFGMQQSTVPPAPEPEKPKEPEQPKITETSKLMQKLIDSEDMRAIEKHKLDFQEWEYKYILDTIKENKKKRKTKK